MRIRYSFWEFGDGVPLDTQPQERDLDLASTLSILDELAQRPPVATLTKEFDGDRAWISVLEPPRALHLYFKPEPDRISYESYQGPNDDLCGLATFDAIKEAVRLFIEGKSPRNFLESHSLELSDTEI